MLAMARQYESLILFHPTTTDEKAGEVVDQLKALIERTGGRLHGSENWGRRKLAYEVGREKKGLYLLLTFEGQRTVIQDLMRSCELEETILKHMTVAVERPVHPAGPTGPVGPGGPSMAGAPQGRTTADGQL